MTTYRYSKPSSIKISRPDKEKLVHIRLQFAESARLGDVELVMTTDVVMMLMMALQKFQALHKIPIPPSLRPRGKPKLTVVDVEE